MPSPFWGALAAVPRRRTHGRPLLLGAFLAVVLMACGQTTLVGTVATPTTTPSPSATPTPATPGHFVVHVTPDPSRSSGRPYVCNPPGGTACFELIDCSGPTSWPFFALSNAGGAALTWSSSFSDFGSSGGGTLTLTPPAGTLSGGASVSVTLSANMNLAENGPGGFTIHFTSGSVDVAIPTQCSNG